MVCVLSFVTDRNSQNKYICQRVKESSIPVSRHTLEHSKSAEDTKAYIENYVAVQDGAQNDERTSLKYRK